MAERDNLQVAEQVVAALNAHDLDRYLILIDDSYVGENEFRTLQGREAARQMLEMYFKAFPDLRVESRQILTSGDHVIARTRLTGTHKGDFLGIPATNRPIDIQSCAVTEIRNGKITRSRVYSENAKLFQQLGVLALPKTAAAG